LLAHTREKTLRADDVEKLGGTAPTGGSGRESLTLLGV